MQGCKFYRRMTQGEVSVNCQVLEYVFYIFQRETITLTVQVPIHEQIFQRKLHFGTAELGSLINASPRQTRPKIKLDWTLWNRTDIT